MSSVYLKIFQMNCGNKNQKYVLYSNSKSEIKFKFNNTIRFLKLKIEILIQIDKIKIKNKTVNQNRKTKLINSFKQTSNFRKVLFIYTSDRNRHQCYH